MRALNSEYKINDEYENLIRNPQEYEGKEIVIMSCNNCGEPILKKLKDGKEVSFDCSCSIKNRVENKIKKFQELSINDRNSGKDLFKNATFDCEEEKTLYIKTKKYSDMFSFALESNAGLLFTGVAGNGKTFLANCICNAIKEKGYTVLSFTIGGYLRSIRDSFGSKDLIETQLLQAVREVDLLFIDDLGSEQISEEWGKEKIFSLIDERYRAGKPILITTNLGIQAMEEKLKFNGANKITDRLYEITKIIAFTWESKRKKKKKNLWDEI